MQGSGRNVGERDFYCLPYLREMGGTKDETARCKSASSSFCPWLHGCSRAAKPCVWGRQLAPVPALAASIRVHQADAPPNVDASPLPGIIKGLIIISSGHASVNGEMKTLRVEGIRQRLFLKQLLDEFILWIVSLGIVESLQYLVAFAFW